MLDFKSSVTLSGCPSLSTHLAVGAAVTEGGQVSGILAIFFLAIAIRWKYRLTEIIFCMNKSGVNIFDLAQEEGKIKA